MISRVETLTRGKIHLNEGSVYPALRELAGEGLVKTRQVDGGRVVKKGDSAFERLLASSVDRVKHTIDQISADLALYAKVLDAWTPRPMPRQGEPQRQPRFFLPK